MNDTLPANFWCAAPTCYERAEWRIEISSATFITCCTIHKRIYRRMLPGVIMKLSSTFVKPKGWKAIEQGHRIVGATRVIPPWESKG